MVRRLVCCAAMLAVVACEDPWSAEDLTALGDPIAFSSISVGLATACGLDGGGRAWCWGQSTATNSTSEMCPEPSGGPGITFDPVPCWSRPVPVSGNHRFTKLVVGNVTWGIDTDGVLWGWGFNRFGLVTTENGNDNWKYPIVIPGVSEHRFQAIDASSTTACGVTTGGALMCWGEPNLVTGAVASPVICPASYGYCWIPPEQIGTATDWVDVAVGIEHACALNSAGRIACWGAGYDGQLGITSTPMCPKQGLSVRCLALPTIVSNSLTFTSVSSDANEVCGVTNGAALYCWGQMTVGGNVLTPTLVASTIAAVQVYGPGYCLVRANGQVGCTSLFTATNVPFTLSVPGAFAGASLGFQNACAWNAAGDAWCVGEGTYGVLGDGVIRTNSYNSTTHQVGAPYKY